MTDFVSVYLRPLFIERAVSLYEKIPPLYGLIGAAALVVIIAALFIAVAAVKRKAKRLKRQLFYDELTGLLSARGFERAARRVISRNKTKKYFIVDFDIDGFESYNSVYGLEAGDEALRSIADLIRNHGTEGELAAHVGADRFLMLVSDESADAVATRMTGSNELVARVTKNGATASFGICEVLGRDDSVRVLLNRASVAKNSIKRRLGVRAAVYDGSLQLGQEDYARLVENIDETLEAFSAVYLPRFTLKSGAVAGVDMLVRLVRDDKVIDAEFFLSLMEQEGLVSRADLAIFELACSRAESMYKASRRVMPLSVPLSGASALNDGAISKMALAARSHRVPPRGIEVALPKRIFFDNPEKAAKTAEALREEGFLTMLEGFGDAVPPRALSGVYIDSVRLSAEFVGDCFATDRGRDILKGVIDLAHELDMKVCAGGVGSEEQLDILKKYGCDEAQGSYLCEPLDAEQLKELITKKKDKPKK